MFRIYDKINDFEYARGATIEQLIDNWNNNAEENFSWILENEDSQDFYNSVIEQCYRIENIEDICRLVNDVEVNCLALYRGNKLINFDEVYNEI